MTTEGAKMKYGIQKKHRIPAGVGAAYSVFEAEIECASLAEALARYGTKDIVRARTGGVAEYVPLTEVADALRQCDERTVRRVKHGAHLSWEKFRKVFGFLPGYAGS